MTPDLKAIRERAARTTNEWVRFSPDCYEMACDVLTLLKLMQEPDEAVFERAMIALVAEWVGAVHASRGKMQMLPADVAEKLTRAALRAAFAED